MHGKWNTPYFTSILGSNSTNTLLAKRQATDWTNQLLTLISHSTDSEAINRVIKYLNAAIGILKALSENIITQYLPLPKLNQFVPMPTAKNKSLNLQKGKDPHNHSQLRNQDFLNARQSLK